MLKQSFKLSLAAALLLPYGAFAAESETPQLSSIEVEADSGTTLSEQSDSLTTSALKTTTGLVLSPKDTPQSVSVITKALLDKRSISTMEGALKTTTGINVIKDAGYWRYQSRGFYIDQIEEDGIASTVRGSTTNTFRDPQSMTDLAVYDHIEVVRGATGLTQAGGEPGGTINAVRKRPTDQFQALGNVQFNTHGKARTMVDVSGPLGAGFRGRFVSVLENDPTFKNLPKDNNKRLVYGVIDKDIGRNSTLTIGALYQNIHLTPDIYGVPMGVNGTNSGLSRKTYLGYDWNREKARKFNVFMEFDTFFNDNWHLKHKLSYTKSDSYTQFGFIATGSASYTGLVAGETISTNNLNRYDNSGDQISYQANLTGKYSLLGREHDLFVTYNYSREKTDTRWRRVRNSDAFDPYTFTGTEISEPNWSSDYNDQIFYDSRVYSTGVALGSRFNPTEKLHILAGTRYSYWKRIGNTYYDWWNGAADSDPDIHSHYSRHRFVPYLGINYDLSPNQSLYASYTSIYKPQSYTNKDNQVLDPVVGNNYELGWKTQWFNGKLNTAVALFQINQKNRPVWVDDSSVSGGGYYDTLGEVRSRGVDIEISGALTEDWQLFAGYTFNRSKYLTNESATYAQGTNFSKHTPAHLFRLYTSYTLPFDDKKWSIGAGVTAQTNTDSLYAVQQAGYALWEANIAYQMSKNIAFNIVGKNLTNKYYYENNRVRTLGINNFYGEGRTVIFNLDWKF